VLKILWREEKRRLKKEEIKIKENRSQALKSGPNKTLVTGVFY
jgi:hypothetical protein